MHDRARPAQLDQRGEVGRRGVEGVDVQLATVRAAPSPGRRRGWRATRTRGRRRPRRRPLGDEAVDEVRADEPGTADHEHVGRSALAVARRVGAGRGASAGSRESLIGDLLPRLDRPPPPRSTASRSWRPIGDPAHHHGVLHDDIIAERDPSSSTDRVTTERDPISTSAATTLPDEQGVDGDHGVGIDAVAAARPGAARRVVAPGEPIEVGLQEQLRAADVDPVVVGRHAVQHPGRRVGERTRSTLTGRRAGSRRARSAPSRRCRR